MLISIVVPTWNSEKYLPTLFECILAQGHRDVEVIVVDNLSTDRTSEVVQYYAKKIEVLFKSEKDKGQGDAVTKGLSLASGAVVHWHAADDFILPGVFAEVESHFSSYDHVDLVFSDGLAFTEGSDRLVSSWPTHGLTKQSMLYHFGRFQSDTAYWRRSLTKHGVPLRNDIPLMVDEEFFVRLVGGARNIFRSPRPLGVFRVRPGQISSNKAGVDVWGLRKDFRARFLLETRSLAEVTSAKAHFLKYKASCGLFKAARFTARKLLRNDIYESYMVHVMEMERRGAEAKLSLGIM